MVEKTKPFFFEDSENSTFSLYSVPASEARKAPPPPPPRPASVKRMAIAKKSAPVAAPTPSVAAVPASSSAGAPAALAPSHGDLLVELRQAQHDRARRRLALELQQDLSKVVDRFAATLDQLELEEVKITK